MPDRLFVTPRPLCFLTQSEVAAQLARLRIFVGALLLFQCFHERLIVHFCLTLNRARRRSARSGKLLRRFKILWGPVQHFELFQQSAGAVLLLSQLYPGSDYLTKVDDKFNTRIGYNLPPVGCLYFANWMGINRTGITAVDLDKDGDIKIVSGLNGVWNRIIVWDAAGKPLREVSFGIGDSLRVPAYGRERSEVRSLYDVLVIESNQRNFIAAATAEALVLFDNKLKKVWSRLLPAEPVITVAGKGYIISGLRNGQLCFYTMQGVLKNIFSNSHAWTAMQIKDDTLFAADSEGNIYQFKL